MREAAATPERDFRPLIDVMRAATSERLDRSGRLSKQRRYVSPSALYSDRAVIELDGKHFPFACSFKYASRLLRPRSWRVTAARLTLRGFS